jgi:hypothetical protein
MSTSEPVIKRHSLPIYFALVFVISWGGGFLILGPGGLPLNGEEFATLGPSLYVANLAGPCLAGLLPRWVRPTAGGSHANRPSPSRHR